MGEATQSFHFAFMSLQLCGGGHSFLHSRSTFFILFILSHACWKPRFVLSLNVAHEAPFRSQNTRPCCLVLFILCDN